MTEEDIKRLNYIKYTAFRVWVRKPHCILYCVCFHVLRVFIYTLKCRFGNRKLNDILFAGHTINNQKSFKTILENLDIEKCSIWSDFYKSLPMAQIYIRSLAYFHLFLSMYFHSSKEDKLLIRTFYTDFINACATYKELEKLLLRNANLKMIVLANDHALVNRCLIELGEKHHIKTLYVQHASVTESFPSLRFDYSFLDGMESYEKYKKVGNMRGKVFLSGSPRFDAFHSYRSVDKKYDVGIALNALDSPDIALQLCLYLKNTYSFNIIVRPHPSMLCGLFDETKFTENGFSVSDPRKDLSYVFLSCINVMVANESSIHLDAALMGVHSFLYNFSDNKIMDWYSYIRRGLIKVCDNFDEVGKMLKSTYALPVNAIQYYAASFHSPMDGRVGEMIAIFIKKMIYDSELSAQNYMDSIMKNNAEYAEYRY